ncbi:zinc finger, C2H2 type [Cooperia oncophora]
MDSHMQVYHPNTSEEGLFKVTTPIPESITCEKCQMTFRTKYQLAVHCISFHGNLSCNSFIVQTSFNSWAQFQPWLEKMEKNTKSVLVKSAMQSFGQKIIHSHDCQFDKAVMSKSSETSKDKLKNCPAFVKVVENEDGVLDCVGFFDHLGHSEESLVSLICGPENCDPTRECSECGEGPMTPVEMNIHWREVHGCSNIKDCEKVKDFYYSCEPCRFHCFTPTLMDSHMQVYHPNTSEEGLFKVTTPIPESITCEKCQMTFRTKYQLAVHCISFHGNLSCNSFIVQTSFNSWAQFQVGFLLLRPK